jgi:hypothetical protein
MTSRLDNILHDKLCCLKVKYDLLLDKGVVHMNDINSTQENLQTRTKNNTRQLFIWTMAWLGSYAFYTFGPKFIWDFNPVLTLIALVINLLLGYKMIVTNKHFLMGLDELQRRIQLEAMGVALGVGLVFGCAYDVFEDQHIIVFKAQIAHLVIVLALTYLVAIIFGNRKYA